MQGVQKSTSSTARIPSQPKGEIATPGKKDGVGIQAPLGVGEGEVLGEGEVVGDGDVVGDGEVDGEGDVVGEGEVVGEGDGEGGLFLTRVNPRKASRDLLLRCLGNGCQK